MAAGRALRQAPGRCTCRTGAQPRDPAAHGRARGRVCEQSGVARGAAAGRPGACLRDADHAKEVGGHHLLHLCHRLLHDGTHPAQACGSDGPGPAVNSAEQAGRPAAWAAHALPGTQSPQAEYPSARVKSLTCGLRVPLPGCTRHKRLAGANGTGGAPRLRCSPEGRCAPPPAPPSSPPHPPTSAWRGKQKG